MTEKMLSGKIADVTAMKRKVRYLYGLQGVWQ
jgi:hypothetical protein